MGIVDRRQFITAGAVVVLSSTLSLRAKATKTKQVIIAGGGLAGLSCAYELQKGGFEVVVLEGNGQPGGRVHTLREGFAPGLDGETGAYRIPDTHELTMSYLREFGLPLEILGGAGLADVVYMQGKNYVVGRGPEPEWSSNLTPEERRLGRAGLLKRYFSDPLTQIRESENSTAVPEAILALDRFSVEEQLGKDGISKAAIELMLGRGDPSVSYALILLIALNAKVSQHYFHIRGGNDLLPGVIAKKLSSVVRYGCRVTSIGQNDRNAWVVIDRNGQPERLQGDYVVSTLPFSVSRDLFADAHLSPEKLQVIEGLEYAPVDKVFLQMENQFWKAQGLNGHAESDLPLAGTFYGLGPEFANERGLLFTMPALKDALTLDRMGEEAKIQATLAVADQVFPGARKHFEVGRTKSWQSDPWHKGALPRYAPGKLGCISVGARQEGRVFFAGEHTSRWSGWMQGALESARRVVAEIIEDRSKRSGDVS
jgi:monoamine oxidase